MTRRSNKISFAMLAVILLAGIIVGQESAQKLSPLAQKTLERRIEEMVIERMEDCRLKAIADAEIIVDSLIIKEALDKRRLEENFPTKPIKPNLPDTTLTGDSLNIKPLFEDLNKKPIDQ